MSKFLNLKLMMFLFFCGLPITIIAQEVSGVVKDDTGALPGVSVVVKGTSTGTTTDFDGNYSISANVGDVLVFSYVGYETQENTVAGSKLNVTMQSGVALEAVVLTGNRSKPRTILDSAVPIDNIGLDEMRNTGQPTVDKMLTYKVPSFNSSTQAISDATAHFDPADLRGLGPSRTLVLVNGKRKNQSALVYINDTPGKGEVGVDLKSIPAAAIERIEVLRDGASAQYGSDAIAGVINMVLKKNVDYTSVNVKSGVTTEGDGFNFGVDLNTGLTGKNGGYLNVTAGYYEQEKTNRPGTPGSDVLFGVAADDPTWGSWLAENPDLGMTVGQPELKKLDLFFNAGIPFKNDSGEFYTFGGVTSRQGKSFALYRTPYWVSDPHNLLHEAGTEYNGFQPTFETDVLDNNLTAGVKWKLFNFDVDFSGTYGRNRIDYDVNNTLNIDLGANSPTGFDVGGYAFSNALANLDFSRSLGQVNIAFGAEIKQENFSARAGEPASYFNPTGNGGAQSFPGLQPSNAVRADRHNYGVYGDVEWEPTDALLIGGAVRYEDFSDFGDNVSWKVSGRYSLGDNRGALRASYSTGFRAPSLHQIYLSNVQTLVSGGTISNQGTFNNVDPIIREDLGVPQLSAETSKNISAGITYKIKPNFSVSADFYNVKVDDRVLFTGEIGFDGDDTTTNPVETILNDNSITSLKFFVNAVNTNTTGVDLVLNYTNINLGEGNLSATLAANFNETTIDGEIDTPELLADNGYEIFNRKEQARITSARPKSKILLGLDYDLNKWNFILNNTYFGEVTWQHANNGLNGADLGNGPLPIDDAAYDQTFAGKIITDLIVGYEFSEKISANISVNNLLNVYPDEIDTKGDFVTDLGGRFKYPWEVSQFGFNGTVLNASVAFKF
ncbi:TonB-dependent receptor [Algibacter pectinivorans]|uniref:Iron complex outermembrane recepter protein n=1 Tax=Algibacter pectinivorans TaxID=870482 RepID=A0A1I1MUU5_9FLAO|nr:TonB-dependent receptor [Algibacter pectinivorans]SFC89141.1 iron complex outermembrane recepter protein [Algibacter pectinivorans]